MPSSARAIYLAASVAVIPAIAWGTNALRADATAAADPYAGRELSPWGQSFAGAYLAGRHAERQFDLGTAADQLDRALMLAPHNDELRQRVFLLQLSHGRFEASLAHAEALVAAQEGLTLPVLRVLIEKVDQGDFTGARALAETIPGVRYNVALRPVLLAWLALGEKGPDAALAELDKMADRRGLGRMLDLHAALINDVANRPAEAAAAFEAVIAGNASEGETAAQPSLRVVQLAVDFYERQGNAERAAALREQYREAHPQSTTLMPDGPVRAGSEPLVGNVREGVAEVLFNLAGIYYDDRELAMALVHARLAIGARPGEPMSTLLVGEILELQKRNGEALALYDGIDGLTPYDAAIVLRRARNLDQQEKTDEAVRLLEEFVATEPDAAVEALQALGHILRGRERFIEAVDAYDRAIALAEPVAPHRWSLFYSRGISLERSKQWDRARVDLQKALELSPDQPYVLNYLGYSWIDRGDNLAEAEKLIRRAVELRPEDGFIADSLGWAFYVTGRYEEAVRELERAVSLEPGDPTINEHLGDAYWKVGRRNEARFQWSHALRLDPEDDKIAGIEAKVRCGLDGCPVKAAHGGG